MAVSRTNVQFAQEHPAHFHLMFRSDALMQDILIGWSHVHGYALLLLEGQLDIFSGAEDRDLFVERTLKSAGGRLSRMLHCTMIVVHPNQLSTFLSPRFPRFGKLTDHPAHRPGYGKPFVNLPESVEGHANHEHHKLVGIDRRSHFFRASQRKTAELALGRPSKGARCATPFPPRQ